MFQPKVLTLSIIDRHVAVPVGTLVLMREAQHVHHLVHQNPLREARVSKLDQRYISATDSLLPGATHTSLFHSLKDDAICGVIGHFILIYPPNTSRAVELADSFIDEMLLVFVCNITFKIN